MISDLVSRIRLFDDLIYHQTERGELAKLPLYYYVCGKENDNHDRIIPRSPTELNILYVIQHLNLIGFACLLWLQHHPKVSFAIHLDDKRVLETDMTKEAGLLNGRHRVQE